LTPNCKIIVRNLVRSISDLQAVWPARCLQQWLASRASEGGTRNPALEPVCHESFTLVPNWNMKFIILGWSSLIYWRF